MVTNEARSRVCLSDDELDRFYAGETPAGELAAIETHIVGCGDCRRRAARLRDEHETGLALIRDAGAPPGFVAEASATALDCNAVVGYEIREEIGRGGQGVAYRALQRGTKREVALKVLREGRFASAAAQRRFEREVELAASLDHPHLVKVLDSGLTRDGRRFVAMDLVAGEPLGLWCISRSVRERVALLAQVCHAVNHAHQRGVIHRDLKPGNVLVVGKWERGNVGKGGPIAPSHFPTSPPAHGPAQPKVLDFGLARSLDEAAGPTLTGLEHVAGTLAYMSPEHARGNAKAIDTRSDVYALGVILYELLSGGFPYEVKGDTIEVLRRIAESLPAPPSLRASGGDGAATVRTEIDADLETIVLKALAKEPERRYQSAGELGCDLERYLADEPIEARRDSRWYLLRKTLRRHRFAFGAATALVLIVTAAAIALAFLYAEQKRLRILADENAEQARLAEQKASARFKEVRTLAHTFVFEVDPLIQRLPGAAPARKLLVENGLQYLDSLADEAAGDRNLQYQVAAAYLSFSDVQGDTSMANLGQIEAALESVDKARAILEAMQRDTPDDDGVRTTLQLCLAKRVDLLAALGRADEALALNRDALAMAEDLARRKAQSGKHLSALGTAHERNGNLLLALGREDEAYAQYDASRRVAEESAQFDDPSDLWAARARAVVLTKLAQIEYRRGRRAESLELYRRFRDAVERLLAAEPANIVPRRDVATAEQWIGILLAESGAPRDALQPYQRSAALLEQLLRDEPESEPDRLNLVTSLSRLGEAQLALGESAAARSAFERCLPPIEAQCEKTPLSAGAQRLRGVTYYKMVELHNAAAKRADDAPDAKKRELRAALEWLRKAREVFADMRERGILPAGDAGVPDELAGEIAAMEKEIGL